MGRVKQIKQSSEIMTNRYKAKPIFAEEKRFIEAHLPQISPLPDHCWITGGSSKTIFLDLYSSEYFVKFKVDNSGRFSLFKDNRELFKKYRPISLEETLKKEGERCIYIYDTCVKRLTDYVKANPNKIYTISHSGGKDSELTMSVWNDMLKNIDFTPDYEFVFFNTSNEIADVYKRIKQIPNIKIINPKVGWRQWIENQNYFLPTQWRRACCTVYKEGQSKKAFDNNLDMAQVIGVRQFESSKREDYEFVMDYDFDIEHFGRSRMPKKWVKIAPIIDLQNIDVWLLLIMKGLPINKRYLRGSNRVGCLICPYSSNYDDELIRTYHPHQYEWFAKAAGKNYDIAKMKRLGWTKQEWIDGAWKSPCCKNSAFLTRKASPENIKLYAKMKGLSEDMAKKFFHRTCGKCGRKMSENEIGMFYKLCGRFENAPDEREVLCKKCLCEQLNMSNEEYEQKNVDFVEQGCSLF